MTPRPPKDLSNGYDAVAAGFMRVRSRVGSDLVRSWAASLSKGAHVIDIGAGPGKPITEILINQGLDVSAIDASPKMIASFRQNFPDIKIACEAAEQSTFFGQSFDAAIAIGLVFLLNPENQITFLGNIARALKPKGRLLFSAPYQKCSWEDVLTKHMSHSLGAEGYKQVLTECGMEIIAQHTDKGENHYYDVQKT